MTRDEVSLIVEEQLHSGTPPETVIAYERLIAEGRHHEQVMKLIGSVAGTHLFEKQVLPDSNSYILNLLLQSRRIS